MKYNVGDKVRVREDLEIGQMFGDSYMFTRSMDRYRGSVLTIRSVNKDYYGVEETYSCWTGDMFEGLVEDTERKSGMKYKVGDRVRVRKDLEAGKLYGLFNANKEMVKMRGETVTIEQVYGDQGYYDLQESKWLWTDEMFEGIVSKKWCINISVEDDRTSAQLYIDNEPVPSKYAEVTRYAYDKFSVEAATEAVVEKLFNPAPKFQDGDIVTTGLAYYRVVGKPKYDSKHNSFAYNLTIGPNNTINTEVPFPENELTLVCKGVYCD